MYNWNTRTAEKVVMRFCLADQQLSDRKTLNEPAVFKKWQECSQLADALIDKYWLQNTKSDKWLVNSADFRSRLANWPDKNRPPSWLLDSIISIASTRKPVY